LPPISTYSMVMKDMDWLGSLKKLWSCQSEGKWHQAQSPRLEHDYTLWAGQKDAEQGRWVICPLSAQWELLMMSSSIACLLLLWAIASSVMRMEPGHLPAKLVNCPASVLNIHMQNREENSKI
jgi:hypothetical protein